MTIQVQAPNGDIVQFPDDTPDHVIADAMRRTYGGPQAAAGPSWMDRELAQAQQVVDRERGRFSTPEGRQSIYDFLAQSVGTAGGIVVGSPAGPVGQMAGGAGGSVAGKQLARTIGPYLGGTGERPDLLSGESVIDAAAGAAGPAAAWVDTPIRAIARTLIGGGTANIKRVEEAGRMARHVEGGAKFAKSEAEQARLVARATGTDEAAEQFAAKSTAARQWQKALPSAKTDEERAFQAAINRAVGRAGLSSSQINLLSGAAYVVSDPLAALTTLVGGHVIRGVHKSVAERLLKSDGFLKWALDRPGKSTPAQIAVSLGALQASRTLTEPERDAVAELRRSLAGERAGGERESDQRRATPPRDGAGRFVSPHRLTTPRATDGAVMFPDLP